MYELEHSNTLENSYMKIAEKKSKLFFFYLAYVYEKWAGSIDCKHCISTMPAPAAIDAYVVTVFPFQD